MSCAAEAVCPSPVNVPNRDRATTMAQRSAAQYGQYSAPTYRTFGLPPSVRAGAFTGWGREVTDPTPTWSRTAAGTEVTAVITASLAGPDDEVVPATDPP